MDIAYYHLGNIDDPMKKIHDKKGEPRLKKGEMVLHKFKKVKCKVFRPPANSWMPMFGKVLFHNAGYGTFIRTTDRIFYLRKPCIRDVMLHTGIKEDEATNICFDGKKWERDGKLESVVINMDEIKKIKRNPGKGLTLNVEDKSGRYIVTFGSALVSNI